MKNEKEKGSNNAIDDAINTAGDLLKMKRKRRKIEELKTTRTEDRRPIRLTDAFILPKELRTKRDRVSEPRKNG